MPLHDLARRLGAVENTVEGWALRGLYETDRDEHERRDWDASPTRMGVAVAVLLRRLPPPYRPSVEMALAAGRCAQRAHGDAVHLGSSVVLWYPPGGLRPEFREAVGEGELKDLKARGIRFVRLDQLLREAEQALAGDEVPIPLPRSLREVGT
jgi:hypothetical protein